MSDAECAVASNTTEFDDLRGAATESLQQLSKLVLEGRRPAPGPYAFFHHSGHCLERVDDVHRVLRRLVAGRLQLTQLIAEEEALRPGDWPAGVPYPRPVAEAMRRADDVVGFMKLDFEALYLFGQMSLDQWSWQALLIGGAGIQRDSPFRRLVVALENDNAPHLAPLWNRHQQELLWLFWQLRFYRNRFVAHANRPWQRGKTYGHVTDDFCLHTPSPPGWLDGRTKAAEVRELVDQMPQTVKQAIRNPDSQAPAALLQTMFNRIGEVPEPEVRARIGKLYGDMGGATPTFQVVGRQLLTFALNGTRTLIDIAKLRLDDIEL